jgi:hypothetical protein
VYGTRCDLASRPDAAAHTHAHAHGHHRAHAEPIVYTLTGILSGTLTDDAGASVTFTDATFSWQVVGDRASMTSLLGLAPAPVFEVPARKDMITIGDQLLVPTIPTVFASATVPAPEPFGIAGFSDVTTNKGLAWQSPALAGYEGVSAVAALPVAFDNAGPLPTNAGDLTITAASGLYFSAITF